MEIVLATRNRKKIEEIRRITSDMGISVFTLDDFPECPEVEENGATFEENAVKKAVAIAQCTNKPSLADDSGLEVYALGGAPGTFSARFAGQDADDRKNMEKLLHELMSRGEAERKARFVCCIAMAFSDGNVRTFFGYTEGTIGREPKGSRGFGYDPLFYPEGNDRTFAEMSNEEKDAISHRGRALRAFLQFLKEEMGKENSNF